MGTITHNNTWVTPKSFIDACREIGKSVVATLAKGDRLHGDTVESEWTGLTHTGAPKKLQSNKKDASGIFATHVPLTGMVSILGYICVQSGRIDLAKKLIAEKLSFGKCLLEYSADNKTNMAPVPEEVVKKYNSVVTALKSGKITVFDYSSMSCLRYAVQSALLTKGKIQEAKEFDLTGNLNRTVIRPKTLIMSLPVLQRKEVAKLCKLHGIKIKNTKVPVAVGRAIRAHKVATLRASYLTLKAFMNAYSRPSDSSVDAVSKKVVECYNTVTTLLKTAGLNAQQAKNAKSQDKADEAWALREDTYNQIAKELETLSDSERIEFTIIDRSRVGEDDKGADRAGLVNWVIALQYAALLMLEKGIDSVAAAEQAGVSSVEKFHQATIDGVQGVALNELSDKAIKDLKRIQELAKEASLTKVNRKGEEYEESCVKMWETLNWTSVKLAQISDMRENETTGLWESLHHRQVHGDSIRQWLIDSYRLANGEAIEKRPQAIRALMAETLVGDGVTFKSLPYTGTIVGEMPAKVKEGDEFRVQFGYTADSMVTVRVRKGANIAKARKRLGAFRMFPEYAIALDGLDVQVLQDGYLKVDAHEGAAFITTSTAGLPCGVYSTARAFLTIGAKSYMLKAVLHVVPDNSGVPANTVVCTPGSLKDELEIVGRDSRYLLMGHRANPLSASTCIANLSIPEQVIACAENEVKTVWTKLTDDSVLGAARRIGTSTLGCIGAWAMIPTQLVGNSERPKNLNFDLTWAGVRKLYVRGAMPWEGGESYTGFHTPYEGCLVVTPEIYERIAEICGGADSDDSYYVHQIGHEVFIWRDPNIGLERAHLTVSFLKNSTSVVTVEVN